MVPSYGKLLKNLIDKKIKGGPGLWNKENGVKEMVCFSKCFDIFLLLVLFHSQGLVCFSERYSKWPKVYRNYRRENIQK